MPLRLGSEDAGAHRAMAAYLVASGAPADSIEPHLKAAARPAETAATSWIRGALLLRDGKIEEARRFLENTNRLSRQETNKDLVRADVLLAQLALAAGQREEARAALQRILEVNPQHVRARSMLETLTPPAAPSGAATPPAPTSLTAPAGPGGPTGAAIPPAGGAPAERAPAGGDSKVEPRGYDTLVAQGRKLSERGHSREAQKLFEKALEERREGVEAHIGLAYCFLDSEHYSSAIDRFQHVLRLSPGNGDALIGLAETYKVRADNERALDYYRQYLKAFPAGSKAEMARANIRDLEPDVARSKSAPPAHRGQGDAAAPGGRLAPLIRRRDDQAQSIEEPERTIMSVHKPSHSEEEYIAKQEALERHKAAMEHVRKLEVEEREKLRQLHHMKCPKCGMNLQPTCSAA